MVAGEQISLVERQPTEQDRAVLEHRSPSVHLRRPAQLPPADPQVGTLLPGEAHRPGPAGMPSDFGRHADLRQPGNQSPGKEAIDGVDGSLGPGRPPHGDRVREIPSVQQRSATGGPADDLHAPRTARSAVHVGLRLKSSQRQRRPRPRVETEGGCCTGVHAFHQLDIGAHLVGRGQ